jgi:hypothetical protein
MGKVIGIVALLYIGYRLSNWYYDKIYEAKGGKPRKERKNKNK